jgi:hypothetical protein
MLISAVAIAVLVASMNLMCNSNAAVNGKRNAEDFSLRFITTTPENAKLAGTFDDRIRVYF